MSDNREKYFYGLGGLVSGIAICALVHFFRPINGSDEMEEVESLDNVFQRRDEMIKDFGNGRRTPPGSSNYITRF